jgi:hypothetical protein
VIRDAPDFLTSAASLGSFSPGLNRPEAMSALRDSNSF